MKFPHLCQTAMMHVLHFNKAFPAISCAANLQPSQQAAATQGTHHTTSGLFPYPDSSFKAATPPHSNTHLITYTLGTFQQSHIISQNIPTCAMLQFNCLHMYHARVSTILFSAKPFYEFEIFCPLNCIFSSSSLLLVQSALYGFP